MKYCSQCGQPVEEGTLFCSYCGAPQTQDQVNPQQAQPTQQVDREYNQQSQDYSQNNYNQNYSQPNQNMNQAGPNQNYNQNFNQSNNQFNQGYAQPNQNINQNYGQAYNPNAMNNGPGYNQNANQNMNQGYAPGYNQNYNPNMNPGAAPGNGFGNKVSGVVTNIKNSFGGKFNLADRNTKIILASAAGAFLLLLILLIGGLNMRGAGSYKGAVKKMMNSMASGNAKKTVHVMFTKKMEKALDQELKEGDLEYMGYDSTVDFIEDMFEEELEDGVKIRDVEITDKDKMTKKQIRDFEEDIEDDMGIKVNVTQAYELEVEYEYREKGDKKWTDEDMDVTAYKVGGRWYIFPF